MKHELIQWLSKDVSYNRNNFDTIISIKKKYMTFYTITS